jgi:4-amino-4-deoxy-L-arabinose transferase-like glycosyltransferase
MKLQMKSFREPAVLLCLGIVTRCIVYFSLSPFNNDAHITIIDYLVKHRTFPSIAENDLAFHPPLYYWLAAPILAISQSDKVVQLLSLVISIGTLIVLYRIVFKEELIASRRAQLYGFLLACFLPQFVMFGLYISNDSLSFLLGSLIVLAAIHFIKTPGWKQCALLALVTGLGLLTKTTFLVFVPVLLVFVCFVQFREQGSLSRVIRTAGIFLLISVSLGSYKYVDNYIRYKNVFINSLDVPVWWFQMGSYHGLRSYFEFNIWRLVASPSIPYDELSGLTSPMTTGSYPLLLYGTFWYQHIPESNFRGAATKPFSYIGSVIYLVALVPTAVFVLGVLRLLLQCPLFVRSFDRKEADDRRRMGVYVAAMLLGVNTALIVATLVRYHVWSLMQGRYLFPSFAGLVSIFAVGVELIEGRRAASVILRCSMIVLMTLFGLYFSSEIGYLVLYRFDPGIKDLIKSMI